MVKEQGESNDLMDRLKSDPSFASVNLTEALDPLRFVGRAPEQVDRFIQDVIEPIRQRYPDDLKQSVDELHV